MEHPEELELNELEHVPPGLIDALLRFAIDPTQWHKFANELDARGQALAQTDPTAFLAALSRAESLSWQLGGEPPARTPGCVYFLLDNNYQVLAHNKNADTLTNHCSIVNGQLVFTNRRSHDNFSQGIAQLAEDDQRQVLVELLSSQEAPRYGYLVDAAHLPAALLAGRPAQQANLRYGLLVADHAAGDSARRVMQASFRLTAAETAICQRLSAGLSLKEVAGSLNISTNTARNHLQAVFGKTGIKRQSDLILMMTQLNVIMAVMSHDETSTLAPQNYAGHHFTIVAAPGSTPRRIAYRRYGQGAKTVVYFHESAGTSRLVPGTNALADRLGLTIIAPERPGSGFSDPLDHYNFGHTAADIAHLLRDLDVREAHLLGFLSGAGHALGAAAHISDDQNLVPDCTIESITLVSGRAPVPFSPTEQSPLAILRRRLIEQPWLLSTFFNIVKNRANEKLLRPVIMSIYGASANDRQFLQTNPDVLNHLVGSALENLTVSGAGIVGEIRCFSNAETIPLASISAPISLWHGNQDSLADADAMASTLTATSYTQKRFPDAGCMLLYEQWENILSEIAAR
ncbi:MAG: alpha/beta fold hydrolase [Pseudomonadota bacterium]